MVEIPAAGDFVTPENYVASLEDVVDRLDSHDVQFTNVADDLIARLGGKDGAATGYEGTINPSTTQTYQDFGSTVGNPDGAGNVAIGFATSFPTGLLTVVVCNGDVASTTEYVPVVVSGDNTSFIVRCLLFDGTPLTSGPVRINWIAVGW